MPRFAHARLFGDGDTTLSRVACDGHDAAPPPEERSGDAHLVIVLRGSFVFRDRGGRTVADPGTVLPFRSGVAHTITHPRGDGDVCLSLHGALARRLADDVATPRTLPVPAYTRLHALATAPALDRLAIEETIADVLAPSGDDAAARATRDAEIARHIAYDVRARFDEQVPLAELAAAAGVSLFHACRAFKHATGVSIHRYRQEIRLRHALAGLLDTRAPIAQIAVEAGFANQGHLTNLFRRRFGVTPRRARGTVLSFSV